MTAPAPISASALATLTNLLETRTGQQIAASRAWRLETALKPVLRDEGCETLEQLAMLLKRKRCAELDDKVIDALLNQETSFFRDPAVMDLVGEAAVEMQTRTGRRARIWSAGCSNGQEPYSLAMLFAERPADEPRPDIVATDVSASAVERARQGRFTQFEIQRGLSMRRMIGWFDQVGEDWVAKPGLRPRIAFRRHNLLTDPPPPGPFDIVLCRNVLLYLPTTLRREVLARLATAVRPGGMLMLGAGETVIGQSDAFRPSQRYRGLYERCDVAVRAA